jgi:hypothetical protein
MSRKKGWSLPHNESNRTRTRELKNNGIHPREVIRQKQEATFRQRTHAVRVHFINESGDARPEFAGDPFGNWGWCLLLHAGEVACVREYGKCMCMNTCASIVAHRGNIYV